MVLTNFECWAHGGSDNLSVNGLIERRGNSADLFNASLLQQSCYNVTNSNQMDTGADATANIKCVSQLSSNGYYGFVAFSNIDNSAPGDYVKKCIGAKDHGEEQHSVNTTSGCNVTMEVEQHYHHMVGAIEPKGVCGNEVNSLLSTGPEILAASVQSSGNFAIGNENDRRKRGFTTDEAADMEDNAIKRFRTDNNNMWISAGNAQMIPRLPYEGTETIHAASAMDHENTPTTMPLTARQTIPHLGLEQNHTYPNAGQISGQNGTIPGMLHPCMENNSSEPSTKSKQYIHSLEINSINKSGEGINSGISLLTKQPVSYSLDVSNSFAKTSNWLQLCLSDVDTKSKIENNIDTNIINTTKESSEANEFICKDENDDLLENLFLSLHGGSNFQMWRHFSNFSNDDI